MSCIIKKSPPKIATTKLEDTLDGLKPGYEFRSEVMWRYEVHDQNGREIKISGYMYFSEQEAREAATEYMKRRDPGGGWSIGQSHQ
jgi:hypothetical protein